MPRSESLTRIPQAITLGEKNSIKQPRTFIKVTDAGSIETKQHLTALKLDGNNCYKEVLDEFDLKYRDDQLYSSHRFYL